MIFLFTCYCCYIYDITCCGCWENPRSYNGIDLTKRRNRPIVVILFMIPLVVVVGRIGGGTCCGCWENWRRYNPKDLTRKRNGPNMFMDVLSYILLNFLIFIFIQCET